MINSNEILIVEDQSNELARYSGYCRSLGHRVYGVSTLDEAQKVLQAKAIDVLLVDLFLNAKDGDAQDGAKRRITNPSGNPSGMNLLAVVQKDFPEVLPIAMSSTPDATLFRRALTLGALGVLKKPLINHDEIDFAIQNARERRLTLHRENRNKPVVAVPSELQTLCPDGIVIDPKTRKLVQAVAKCPQISAVLLGETGTGKEEIVKLIHRLRCQETGDIPLVSVNCALLNSDIAASELFGHAKGAFSSADSTTQGLIGEADGGILFLDEIHRMSLKCQEKLLRVLNDGTYCRVGDTKMLHSKFQVIAATSIDLDLAVQDGILLLDLRARLIGIDIHLLPLRERKHEIPLLIKLLFATENWVVPETDLEAFITRCGDYYWQGNIRQMVQVLKSTAILAMVDGATPHVRYMPTLLSMLEPRKC